MTKEEFIKQLTKIGEWNRSQGQSHWKLKEDTTDEFEHIEANEDEQTFFMDMDLTEEPGMVIISLEPNPTIFSMDECKNGSGKAYSVPYAEFIAQELEGFEHEDNIENEFTN